MNYTDVDGSVGSVRHFAASHGTVARGNIMSVHARENLSRLMAAEGLSIHDVAEKTGLDERTIRGILSGANKPHARSLHRLAKGLGVAIDEFYVNPTQLLYRRFDRETNPMVEESLKNHPELFAGWRESDFDELHSRMGEGGALTEGGTLEAVRQMNRKRELHERLDVLLESTQAELVAGMIDLAYNEVVKDE